MTGRADAKSCIAGAIVPKWPPGNQPVSTLPKSRYPSRPARSEAWPGSGIHPVAAREQAVSGSSSLFDLQAQASALPAEPDPVVAEPGAMAIVSLRLQQLHWLLRRLGRWWMAADFRKCQLPILVLALGVWAMSARAAWQSQDSGTPLLRESISQIRQARAHAAVVNFSTAAPSSLAPKAQTAAPPTVSGPASVEAQPDAATPAREPAVLQPTVKKSGRSFPGLLLASIEHWFDSEPAAPERVKGNPHRRVWVDLKTGLYYCPGADYYGFGGADRGKVMSQRDAEYEYFQPATGAPCQ